MSGHAHFDVKRIFIYQERGDQVLISYPTQAARSTTNLGGGWGEGGGGRIRLGILGGGVPPSSLNPDPVSDQKQ